MVTSCIYPHTTASGHFRWEDDSAVDYANWAKHQPSSSDTGEKCVRMQPGSEGKWEMAYCSFPASYLCMMPQYQEGNPPSSTVCPDDDEWASWGDHCYMLSDAGAHNQTSWSDAEVWCNRHGGYLASIDSQAEQDFITKMRFQISPRFWIGLKEASDNVYEWSDGTESEFRFWDEGQPNDFVGEEKCVELNMMLGGKWNNLNCGVKQNFVCKKRQNATSTIVTPTASPITGGCPDGWVQVKAKCFKVFSGVENWKTRMGAATECKKYNDGYLAIINNKGEQAFLITLMEPSNETLWIGLSNIGAMSQYHWSDGSPLSYENWVFDPYRPSETRCVVMRNDTDIPGQWGSVHCNTKANFACTTAASPDLKIQPSFLHNCNQPGYISYHDACFRYDAKPRTFDEATQFCESDGNTMATVRDKYDVALATALAYLYDSSDAWIGLRKEKESYAFRWSDSWPFLYTNWRAGKPSGPNTVGFGCAAVDTDGYWYDTSCSEKRPTICKNTTASPPTTRQPYVTGVCPYDYMVAWGSHCYFFVSKKTVISEGFSPSYYCTSRYLYPVSVHSKAENAFLTTQAKDMLGEDSIRIGIYERYDGYLVWDNSYWTESQNPSKLVDFVNWDSPGAVGDKGDCVELMLNMDGAWRFTNCSNSVGIVCKTSQTSPDPTEQPTSDGKLSPGALAGIIVGSVIGAPVLIIVLTVIVIKLQKSTRGSLSFGAKDTSSIIQRDY